MDVGYALMEVFTAWCSGWINCLGVENDRLRYKHYVAYENKTSFLPYYSEFNTSSKLLLPAGDEKDDYRNQITVVVSNMANYTSNNFVIYPITVSSPRSSSAYEERWPRGRDDDFIIITIIIYLLRNDNVVYSMSRLTSS